MTPEQIAGYVGFGDAEVEEPPTSTGMARGFVPSLFGCPDRLGMLEISEGKRTLCYWVKRPVGLIGLAVVAYVAFKMLKPGD